MAVQPPEIQPAPVHIRHIRPGVSTSPGAVQVLSRYFYPDRRGVNGQSGYVSGTIEPRLCEEGTLALKFPNADGVDGTPHRERFEIIRRGKVIPLGGNCFFFQGGNYRPGDEFLEVWLGQPPTGDLLFVGTPTQATLTPSEIGLNLQDAYFLSRKTRATAADVWANAPRDVFEYYTGVWTALVADGFDTTQRAFVWSTSALQVSSDGVWAFTRADTDFVNEPGVIRLRPNAATTRSELQTTATLNVGLTGTDQDWRAEATFRAKDALPGGGDIGFGLYAPTDIGRGTGYYVYFQHTGGNTGTFSVGDPAAGLATDSVPTPPLPATFSVAIEGRNRWLYFYINNALIRVMPMIQGANNFRIGAYVDSGTTAGNYASIDSVLVRKRQPFLMRGTSRGDYAIPGAPPPAGFLASYFNLSDIKNKYGATNGYRWAFALGQQPYAKRTEKVVNNGSVGFQPLGPTNDAFGVRWCGSMNLDLANYDYRFRITYAGSRIRLGVGKTLPKDLLVDSGASSPWTSGWVKADGGVSAASGWIPFILELIAVGAAQGTAIFEYQRSDDLSTTWTLVNNDGRVQVSPLGLYQNEVRYESHYDQIQNMKENFGLQWRVEARSLESGLFPGEMVPRTRVGRDTTKVLELVEATDVQDQISAENVADALLAEGSGTGDQGNNSSVIVEGVNFAEVANHLFVHQEYESLSDINMPDLLQQRAQSLLALRGAPWEQVQAKPRGFRELLDKFPLAGQLAEFKWEPGDGARLNLPQISVVDASPRQILGVSRDFTPDGLGAPSVSFRQRPRGWDDLLRRMFRTSLNSDRNFQGTVYTLQGMHGWNPAVANAGDTVSRVVLPPNVGDVIKAEVVVFYKSDTSAWNININGTNRRTGITAPDRYDVTEWVLNSVATGGTRYVYADMNGPGTGQSGFYLELTVRRMP